MFHSAMWVTDAVVELFTLGQVRTGNLADDHVHYVAGRYRDGLRSDHWTDVRRCAEATFVAYSASCSCGWAGPDRAADDRGYRRSGRDGQRHQAEHAVRLPGLPLPGLFLAPRIEATVPR